MYVSYIKYTYMRVNGFSSLSTEASSQGTWYHSPCSNDFFLTSVLYLPLCKLHHHDPCQFKQRYYLYDQHAKQDMAIEETCGRHRIPTVQGVKHRIPTVQGVKAG